MDLIELNENDLLEIQKMIENKDSIIHLPRKRKAVKETINNIDFI